MTQRGTQINIKPPFASLSILLVSSLPGFCTNLRSAIFRARKLKAHTLKVHLCETVQQVVDANETDVQVDYVVFGMDIQKSNCVEQVKQDLKLLNSSFMSSGNYCMVISTSVPCFEMAVTWGSIQDLQTTYQMPVINGDTEDEDKCNYLGQRILGFIESVMGRRTGFPIFTASTYEVHGEEDIVARRQLAFMDDV